MTDRQTILCIDDNTDSCELISFIFLRAGYEVITTTVPQEGIRLARTKDFAAILLDFRFADMDGVDLCRIIRSFDPETPIIFYTGEARSAKKEAAFAAGAQAYLIKPEGFEQLEKTVTELISQHHQKKAGKIDNTTHLSFSRPKTDGSGEYN